MKKKTEIKHETAGNYKTTKLQTTIAEREKNAGVRKIYGIEKSKM